MVFVVKGVLFSWPAGYVGAGWGSIGSMMSLLRAYPQLRANFCSGRFAMFFVPSVVVGSYETVQKRRNYDYIVHVTRSFQGSVQFKKASVHVLCSRSSVQQTLSKTKPGMIQCPFP